MRVRLPYFVADFAGMAATSRHQNGTALLIAGAVLFVFPFLAHSPTAAITLRHPPEKHERMSADVTVHLFDINTYKKRVLPALRTYLTANDPRSVLALLNECNRILEANPKLSKRLFWDSEMIKEGVGILDGTVYYSPDGGKTTNQGRSNTARRVKRYYAGQQLGPMIVEILCVPFNKGVDPEQDMTNSRLVTYLYDRSDWIKDVFTFSGNATGRGLEFPIGESTEPFTERGMEELDRELNKVEDPTDAELRRELDNFRAVVKKALAEPDLILVLSVR